MKKIIGLWVILFLCGAVSAAQAKTGAGFAIDASLQVADETYKGSDAAIGFGLGVSYDLGDVVQLGKGRLAARGDISVFQGSSDYILAKLDSSRVPFFIGVRYFLPLDLKPLDLYAEGGLELSMDKYEQPLFLNGFLMESRVSDTNLGVTPGFGAILPLGDNFSLGLNARLHVITGSYLSFGLTAGYSF